MTSAALRRVLEPAGGPAHAPQPRERGRKGAAPGAGPAEGRGQASASEIPGPEWNETAPRRLLSVLSGREERQPWSPRRTAMNLPPQDIPLAFGGAVRGGAEQVEVTAGNYGQRHLLRARASRFRDAAAQPRANPPAPGRGQGTRVHRGRPRPHPEPLQPGFTFQEVKTFRAPAS